MKNQLFALFAVVMALGFTTIGYSETVVSLVPTTDITAPAVGEQVKVDIEITGGEGVAGYGSLLLFDATALKYIDATGGDYLPTGGIWMGPRLSDDGNYEILLTIGDSTTSGETVLFGPMVDAPGASEEVSIDSVLFKTPEPLPEHLLELAAPGRQYWALALLASSPLGAEAKPTPTDGDGTLATLTFEVVEAKPTTIALLEINLSDTDDETLETTVQNSLITVNALDASAVPPVDVNGDGDVNILDLVFVASKFGQPVTDATKTADVNGDDEINILDLVSIAQHFGN